MYVLSMYSSPTSFKIGDQNVQIWLYQASSGGSHLLLVVITSHP